MAHGHITHAARTGDGVFVALLGSVALALASAAFLLATPHLLQTLQSLSMPGLAPL
jgi:hypothetical protein